MLKNYDAKAVAEIMGIAFLEDMGSRPVVAAGSAKTTRAAKAAASTAIGQFVIHIDDKSVQMVEISSNHMFGLAKRGERRGHHNPATPSVTVRSPSPALIEKAVENGLPRLALRHVAEQIAGLDKAKIAALEWVIVPKTTLERREEQLSPLESERTERVARLFVHARRALGSNEEARAFMTAPHPQLDGRIPVDAAKTDLGARRAEQILNALEYGLAL